MIFRAFKDGRQPDRTVIYRPSRRVSDARKELLKDARPSGILCVCCYSPSIFLFTSKTVQRTHTSKLLCMGKQKESSWTILGLTMRERWNGYLNWVGSGDAWSNEKLTVTLSKYLVCWTREDIDREVQDIAWKSQAAFPKISSLGRDTYYQYLHSARGARDALQNRSTQDA